VLENLIRVGPPQGNLTDVHKHQEDHDPNIRKNEFEKEFKKANKRMEDEEQVPKKLSGGIKKKTIRADQDDESDAAKEAVKQLVIIDPSMISNGLVSKEDEVGIADFDTNLLEVEDLNNNNAQNQLSDQIKSNSDEGQLLPSQYEFKHLNAVEQTMMDDLTDTDLQNVDSDYMSIHQNVNQLATTSNEAIDNEVNVFKENFISENNSRVEQFDLKEEYSQNLNMDASSEKIENDDANSSITNSGSVLERQNQTSLSNKLNLQEKIEKELRLNLMSEKVNTDMSSSLQVNENAFSSKEFEQGFQQESQKESQSDGKQASLKQDARHDLSSQISALHIEQKGFNQHLGLRSSQASDQKLNVSSSLDLDDNVKNIMNQARFLVTKGGGEMTVRMTPEGMGEVQLKVMLDQGNINLELNTQDKSVKKLIEDNLSDLKSSLALHQMRVDHVKINSVTAMDTGNQTQFQSNLNYSNPEQSSYSQNQNGQAQMNFSQGRNENSFFDREQRDQKRYADSTQTKMQSGIVVAPTATTSLKSSKYNVGVTKGSSINMVA